jgi:hypothetical protein
MRFPTASVVAVEVVEVVVAKGHRAKLKVKTNRPGLQTLDRRSDQQRGRIGHGAWEVVVSFGHERLVEKDSSCETHHRGATLNSAVTRMRSDEMVIPQPACGPWETQRVAAVTMLVVETQRKPMQCVHAHLAETADAYWVAIEFGRNR